MRTPEINPAYTTQRNDLLQLVPPSVGTVLDIGCCTGKLGKNIKKKYGAKVIGIDIDRKCYTEANKNLDRIYIENIETMDLKKHLKQKYFDLIIFGDVLEHLVDPWIVLQQTTKHLLKNDGVVIASIPNIRYYKPVWDLLINGKWHYKNYGICDKNHLRFFTLSNIKDMFFSANLEIMEIQRAFKLTEKESWIKNLTVIIRKMPIRDFFTYQYLIRAHKKEINSN